MEDGRRILIFYNDSGGGHRVTAHALRDALYDVGEVELVNPIETFYAPCDWFARWTRRSVEDVYNEVVLARSWGTLATSAYYGVCLVNQLCYRRQLVDGLHALFAARRPDLVLSVLPGINHLFVSALARLEGAPPLAILNVDLHETFPYSWFPRKGPYYAITGTERSTRQALRATGSAERVLRTSGMPVREALYAPGPDDLAEERARLGLGQGLTVCVHYGGVGSTRMRDLALWLDQVERPVQAIYLCGHNHALRNELAALDLRHPHVLVPFTPEIVRYLDVADCLIGKPGPGFISEALVRRRPLLIDRSHLLPQERYNARWVVETGVGLPFASRRELLRALGDVGDPATRAGLAEACGRHDNRAIFEVPGLLRGILERHR